MEVGAGPGAAAAVLSAALQVPVIAVDAHPLTSGLLEQFARCTGGNVTSRVADIADPRTLRRGRSPAAVFGMGIYHFRSRISIAGLLQRPAPGWSESSPPTRSTRMSPHSSRHWGTPIWCSPNKCARTTSPKWPRIVQVHNGAPRGNQAHRERNASWADGGIRDPLFESGSAETESESAIEM